MTLEEIKNKTLEQLDLNDSAAVEHITQDLVDKDKSSKYEDEDQEDSEKGILNVIEGHNVRLQYIDGTYYWVYERGNSPTGQGCGNAMTVRLSFNLWSGISIGRCTGNDHLVRFSRI